MTVLWLPRLWHENIMEEMSNTKPTAQFVPNKNGLFFLLLFGRYFGFSKDNINQSKGNKKRVRKNKAIHQSVPTLGVQINQYINIQGLITAV